MYFYIVHMFGNHFVAINYSLILLMINFYWRINLVSTFNEIFLPSHFIHKIWIKDNV